MRIKKFLAFCFGAFFAFSCGANVHGFNGKENFSEARPNNWMSYLPDSALITNINIPGTHDSGTARVTACTEEYAKCQSKSIKEQLNSGVRYLDLRVNDKGLINHGGVSCWKSFFWRLYIQDVESYVTDFLRRNPTETVILQIKSEGGGNCANVINNSLVKNSLCYRSKKDIEKLKLEKVRGKFIIFSRQEGITDAYNYYSWDDNVSFDDVWLDSKEGYLQDKYTGTVANKKETIDQFYDKVWKDEEGIKKLVINFTSFTQMPITLNFLYPGVNDYMSIYVDENRNKKFGIILMDDPSNNLIEKIYKTNYNRDF